MTPRFDPMTGNPLAAALPDDPEALDRLIAGATARKAELAAAANPNANDPARNVTAALASAGIDDQARAQLADTPLAGVMRLLDRQMYAASVAATPEQKVQHEEWVALVTVVLGLVQSATNEHRARVAAGADGANVV